MSEKGLPTYGDAKRDFPPLRAVTYSTAGSLDETMIDRMEDKLDKQLAEGKITERTYKGMLALSTGLRNQFKPGVQVLDSDIIENK